MKKPFRLVLALVAAASTIGGLHAWQDGDGGGWQPAKAGAEHALLKAMEGSFEATFQLRAPGAPAIKSKGTAKNVLSMKGLWLVGEYHDPSYMGGEYRGLSALGYDPKKERYCAMWIDSSDARMQVMEGTYDEATKTLTMLSSGTDPYSGKPTVDRSITQIIGDGHHLFTLKSKTEGQAEIDIFTIDYRRK